MQIELPPESTNSTAASKAFGGKGKLVVVGILLTFVLVGGVKYLASQSISNTNEQSAQAVTDRAAEDSSTSATACQLPLIERAELAVKYGVPEGWVHNAEDDVITIAQTDEFLTAAFIYTAQLNEDKSAGEFLTAFGEVFRTIIEAEGRTFTLSDPSGTDTKATAQASASIEEGEVKGPFEVRKEGNFVTFLAYWAPTDQFSTKESQLREVIGCFARDTVLTDAELAATSTNQTSNDTAASLPADTLKSVGSGDTYQGQYFSLYLPAGWKVTGESDSGIDTANAAESAGFSYAYATGTDQAIEHASWAADRLGAVGISGASLGSGTNVPVDFQGYSVKAFPFSGTFNAFSVDGKITVGVYNTPDFGLGSYGSAFWGIQLAESSLWPSISSTTQQIQDSLLTKDIGSTRKSVQLPTGTTIDDAGGSAITEGYAYRNAIQDKSAGAWSSAMRGYESYQSPSTGDQYDVPLNAYNPSGPDGAGYYRQLPGSGGLEKLEPAE